MFPFDHTENIRKRLVVSCFQGVKRKHWEEKGEIIKLPKAFFHEINYATILK